MVGASTNWNRPSLLCDEILAGKRVQGDSNQSDCGGRHATGRKIYATLDDVPDDLKGEIDMVDIFRRPSDVGPIVQDLLERLPGVKTIWMQLEVVNEEAASLAEENGLNVVMDRCPKIEFSRLFGELGWHGFNSKIFQASEGRLAATERAPKAMGPSQRSTGLRHELYTLVSCSFLTNILQ